jgi:hypothetical protein
MMEVSDTYILPIVGYRGWVLREGKLSSCVVDNLWIPKKANVAQCDKHRKFWLRSLQSGPGPQVIPHEGHVAPLAECQCGFYAFKTLPQLVEWLEHRETELDLVIGDVYLWGKVVDCEHGYRAQYAYPKRFYNKGYEYSSADNNSTFELREFNVPVEPMPERVTFTSHDPIRRGAPWLSRFAEAFRRLCFP